jgi:1-carboxybiuret hydrolase
MTFNLEQSDAVGTATAVLNGETTATAVTQAALERIAAKDGALNCFTEVLHEQALEQATHVDEAIAAGSQIGALTGVPFAVKNLFDISGLPTLSGSKINCDHPPADRDTSGEIAVPGCTTW